MAFHKREEEIIGGVKKEYFTDDVEGRLVIKKTQDTSSILKNNKAIGDLNNGYNEDRTRQLVAEVPAIIYEQWVKELIKNGITDAKERQAIIFARLNDSEYAHFRVGQGTI